MDNYADRAKQFLAFAALTGFDALLREQELLAEQQADGKQEKTSDFSEFPEFLEKNNADSC